MLEELLRSEPTRIEAEYRDGFFVTFEYVSTPAIEKELKATRKMVEDAVASLKTDPIFVKGFEKLIAA